MVTVLEIQLGKRDFYEKLSIRILVFKGAMQLKSNNITKQPIFFIYSTVDEIFHLEINKIDSRQ